MVIANAMFVEHDRSRQRVSRIWMRFGFLCRAAVLPNEIFRFIPEEVLEQVMANFYKGFERTLGELNCKINLHLVRMNGS